MKWGCCVGCHHCILKWLALRQSGEHRDISCAMSCAGEDSMSDCVLIPACCKVARGGQRTRDESRFTAELMHVGLFA